MHGITQNEMITQVRYQVGKAEKKWTLSRRMELAMPQTGVDLDRPCFSALVPLDPPPRAGSCHDHHHRSRGAGPSC
jgi:hypothetical protein